jgi:hypothetical protein
MVMSVALRGVLCNSRRRQTQAALAFGSCAASSSTTSQRVHHGCPLRQGMTSLLVLQALVYHSMYSHTQTHLDDVDQGRPFQALVLCCQQLLRHLADGIGPAGHQLLCAAPGSLEQRERQVVVPAGSSSSMSHNTAQHGSESCGMSQAPDSWVVPAAADNVTGRQGQQGHNHCCQQLLEQRRSCSQCIPVTS